MADLKHLWEQHFAATFATNFHWPAPESENLSKIQPMKLFVESIGCFESAIRIGLLYVFGSIARETFALAKAHCYCTFIHVFVLPDYNILKISTSTGWERHKCVDGSQRKIEFRPLVL